MNHENQTHRGRTSGTVRAVRDPDVHGPQPATPDRTIPTVRQRRLRRDPTILRADDGTPADRSRSVRHRSEGVQRKTLSNGLNSQPQPPPPGVASRFRSPSNYSYPTDPSISNSINLFNSIAYSSGKALTIGSIKPATTICRA